MESKSQKFKASKYPEHSVSDIHFIKRTETDRNYKRKKVDILGAYRNEDRALEELKRLFDNAPKDKCWSKINEEFYVISGLKNIIFRIVSIQLDKRIT